MRTLAGTRVLAALLEALRRPVRGAPGEVLAAWVGALEGSGAAAWLARACERWQTRAAVSPGLAAAESEAPDGLAWDLLPSGTGPSWLRLGAAELRAYPALAARGVREAAWLVGEEGRWALWLEARAPGLLERADSAALLSVLVGLEALVAEGEGRRRSEELERRARIVLGTQHDLRNQLTLALLELERRAAGSDGQREPEGSPGADPALHGLRRALASALELARWPLADREGTAGGASPAPVGLRSLLREELRAASHLGGAAERVRLLLRCPRELASRAGELELRRWVRNALLNALRASPAGGSVRVVGEPRAGGGLILTVEDEGSGMDPDQAARLFEPGISGGEGSGHGTTALLECARALGAELVLETGLGAGSCLRLELPASA